MAKNNLQLSTRVEEVRDKRSTTPPVQFSLNEIKQHFEESLNSIKAQYDVADKLKGSGNSNDCKTIWRSQIVLSEGLLDFFIHEISKYCLFRMFTGKWKKTNKYATLMIPMEQVENAITAAESNDWFFNYLNNRFSRDVFLSVDSMRDQLNMIGIGFSDAMMIAFPGNDQKAVNQHSTDIIRKLFQRRNEIAHQNDRSHASAIQADISKEYVMEYINNIEAIVNGIFQIAVNNDNAE